MEEKEKPKEAGGKAVISSDESGHKNVRGTNIVLIGMMGTFKSSSGKLAAKTLEIDFFDTDDEIEKICGQKIKDIFETKGEQYFRQIEKDVIKAAALKENTVISCGGGVVLNGENMLRLKENGIVILLKADSQAIYERVKNYNNRPLLNHNLSVEKILQIQKSREDLYEKYKDYAIDNTNKSSAETANLITEIIMLSNNRILK